MDELHDAEPVFEALVELNRIPLKLQCRSARATSASWQGAPVLLLKNVNTGFLKLWEYSNSWMVYKGKSSEHG